MNTVNGERANYNDLLHHYFCVVVMRRSLYCVFVDFLAIQFAESQCLRELHQSVTPLLHGCVHLNTTTELRELRYKQCCLARCGVSGVDATPLCCQPHQLTPVLVSCSGRDVKDLLQINELVFSQLSAESCTCQPCSGVEFELAGSVRGMFDEPVPMARVSLRGKRRVTFTTKNGLFAFRLNGSVSTVELEISAGEYRTLSFTVELNPGLHREHFIQVTLNPEWVTVLHVPDSSVASVLVTVVASRTVVAIHSGRLWEEDSGGVFLSLPEPFRQAFLDAGFAVVVGMNVASTSSLQTVVSSLLVVTEVPTLEHTIAGSVNSNSMNFTLSSDEDEILLAREMFRLRMYMYSAGKLQSVSKVLKTVANFTLQLIRTGQTGSDYNLFNPSDSENQGYTQHAPHVLAVLRQSKRRRKTRQLNAEGDTSSVVMSAVKETSEVPEQFLVGLRVPSCFVGVRAFSRKGVERDGVLVVAIISNQTVVTMATGTSPVCIPVPCPNNNSHPFLVTISATDRSLLAYVPESFVFVLETSSLLLFPNRTACQNTSLSIGAHESSYIAFREPDPDRTDNDLFSGLLTPASVVSSSSSVQDPPYCYLKIEIPHCDTADIRIFVASHSSGEISAVQTGTVEGPEFGSSGMSCDNVLSFCLSYVCSSNVSVRMEKWLPNAVEPVYCDPESMPPNYYNRDSGVLVLPLATTEGNSTDYYSIFYSLFSKRRAHVECQRSPFSTLQYNCVTQ